MTIQSCLLIFLKPTRSSLVRERGNPSSGRASNLTQRDMVNSGREVKLRSQDPFIVFRFTHLQTRSTLKEELKGNSSSEEQSFTSELYPKLSNKGQSSITNLSRLVRLRSQNTSNFFNRVNPQIQR
ncbi:hypothetical protein Droror1_Dr00020790 [Drosera rotundifolia]